MRISALTPGLAGAFLVACSGGILGPGASEIADIREMKTRILDLQKQAAETEAELASLREEMAELERQLEQRGEVEARSPAPGDLSLERPSTAAASGSMAEGISPPLVSEGIEESDLEVPDVRTPTPTELPQAGSSQPPSAAQGVGETAPADEPQSEPPRPVEPAAQALYDRGYTLYHQGQYLEAESTFQRFLQAYSDTELADNAQYWIGESRFARGDLQGALSAFRETVERYPGGNKVADAMIKEGDSLAGLGDLAGARGRYEEVVRRFPGSAAALMGEERLAGLQ